MIQRLIELPSDVNRGGLISLRRAAEVTGIEYRTLRSWKDEHGSGLRAIQIRRRLYFRVSELIRWLEAEARYRE